MSEVSVAAALAVLALGVVAAGLLARGHAGPRHVTRAVAVTLTRGTRGEVPLLPRPGVARVAPHPGPGPRPRHGAAHADPLQGALHTALVAGAQPVVLALVAPPARGVVEARGARVVAAAEVGHRGVGLAGALLEVRGPVHALAVGEGGQVGVPVDTHLHVLAPHAHGARAVGAGVPQRARHGAARLGLLLGAALLAVVEPGGEPLPLLALLLAVPHALVDHVAAVAGVEVGADLLGLGLETLRHVAHDLHVLGLGTLGAVAVVPAPHAAAGVGEARAAGGLRAAHHARVALLPRALHQAALLAAELVYAPVLAAPRLLVPDTLDPVPARHAAGLVRQVAAAARHEPHDVALGLPVEAAVDVDAGVVEDGSVAEPVQVRAEVPGDGAVQTGPGVTEDVVGEELLAVALGALAVLGVVVSVATEYQHQALVDAGTVEISEAGAGAQHLPLPFLVVEGVETVGELGHTAGHADVAAVHEDQVGQLI